MEEKTYIYIQIIYGKFKAHKIKKNKALKMLEGDNFIVREDAYQVFIASMKSLEHGFWLNIDYNRPAGASNIHGIQFPVWAFDTLLNQTTTMKGRYTIWGYI